MHVQLQTSNRAILFGTRQCPLGVAVGMSLSKVQAVLPCFLPSAPGVSEDEVWGEG